MKKKLLGMILVICTVAILFVGCGKSDEKKETAKKENTDNTKTESIDINIGCMKGPTGIGMIKLLSDSDEGMDRQKIPNYIRK